MVGVNGLAAYLQLMKLSTSVGEIKREDIENFLIYLKETAPDRHRQGKGKPIATWTLHKYYKGMKVFFNWLVAEEEITVSPMARIKAPKIVETPVPIIEDSAMKKLLSVCEGRDFYARRDTAIFRILIDTGMRRSEIGKLQLSDVDLDTGMAYVIGKGSRPRGCPLGRKAVQAIDRYLRARESHSAAKQTDALWLGHQGAMGLSGLRDMLIRRAKQAGFDHAHLHMFRHTFAHGWRIKGGQNDDLKRLMGWSSDTMLYRYGASAADERAKEAHRRLSPGDKI